MATSGFRTLLVLFTLSAVVLNVLSQPIVKTNWQTINQASLPSAGYPLPRVALFSNKDYIVVYPIGTDVTGVRIVGQIFFANGSVSIPEFQLTTNSGQYTAPNVIVFSDNTFLAAWRNNGINRIEGVQCNSNGVAYTAIYILDHVSLPPTTPNEPFELLRVVNNDYIIGYVSGTQLTYKHFANKETTTIYIMTNSAGTLTNPHASIIADATGEVAYYIHERSTSALESLYLFRYVVANRNGPSMEIPFMNGVPSYPIPVLTTDQSVLSTLYTNTPAAGAVRTIRHVAADVAQFQYWTGNTSLSDRTQSSDMSHAVHVGNDYILAAYTGLRSTVTTLIFRMTRVLKGGSYSAAYGPELIDDNPNAYGARMIVVGSDVVVIAKDRATGNIIRKVLTFCGNGIADADESCDGTEFCTNRCTCAPGTTPVNGLCVPLCGDGVVLGDEECDGSAQCTDCRCNEGYRPDPNAVGECTPLPAGFTGGFGVTLDCVEISGDTFNLHFSFDNQDGFYQTIPHGGQNLVTPATIGADRPVGFPAGRSLTYPASPYIMRVPASLRALSWQLNDKRLSIDLTNPAALACPTSLQALVLVESVAEINEQFVTGLLANVGAKYGVTTSRLSASYEEIDVEQRSLVSHAYIINMTIDSDPTEKSSSAVLSDLVSEFKNDTTKEEVTQELLQELEDSNPRVKDIVPSPIEMRGSSYEPAVNYFPKSEQDPQSNAAVLTHSLSLAVLVLYMLN